MRHFDPLGSLLAVERWKVLLAAAGSTAVIAFMDWAVITHFSLGFLYLFPILMVSAFLKDWQIAVIALLCTLLREALGPNAWDAGAAGRMSTGIIAFAGVGLFVGHMAHTRLLGVKTAQVIDLQARLRRQAEEEARMLLETTPAAVFTLDADGRILAANQSAHKLLGVEAGRLYGQVVGKYLPILAGVLNAPHVAAILRTMVEGSGYRSNGEAFFAHMWLSTYQTGAGLRLAALVTDASEQLRDRQEAGLRQLLTHSHILASAVSHEIRNMAAGTSVLHANLSKVPGLADNEDFSALGRLVDGLQKLASDAARQPAEKGLASADVNEALEELRIILNPSLEEAGIELQWEVAPGLPRVRAEHHALLEVFLNLAQNSVRALKELADPQMSLVAYALEDHVLIRFSDSGPGVKAPDRLFQPFRSDGGSGGLGLFVSRAILRTFGGELQYESGSGGWCFLVDLPVVAYHPVTAHA